MGSWRFSLAVVAALSLVGLLLVDVSDVAAAKPSSGVGSNGTQVSGNSCHGVFSGSPPGSLFETTSAGPDQNLVTPNQTLTVTLEWHPGDFGGNPPSKTDVCVEIGSQISAVLSQEHKPGPNGGSDTFKFTVPDGTGDQPICVRGAVSGPMTSTEKSEILCYTVQPATVTPEVPFSVLFPLAGLLVGGGALLVHRRQRLRPAR